MCVVFQIWLWIVAAALQVCFADLPIHAAINQVRNNGHLGQDVWRFFLSSASDEHQLCGSGMPNSNVDMLSRPLQNYVGWLNKNMGGIKGSVDLVLMDVRGSPPFSSILDRVNLSTTTPDPRFPPDSVPNNGHRTQWTALNVLDSKTRRTVVGGWTMIYDEGFEIYVMLNDTSRSFFLSKADDRTTADASTDKLSSVPRLDVSPVNSISAQKTPPGVLVFFSFFKYFLNSHPASNAEKNLCQHHTPSIGEGEKPDGSTLCYVTDPNQTAIGWYYYLEPAASNPRRRYGCFYAKKTERFPEKKTNDAFVETSLNNLSSSSYSFVQVRVRDPNKEPFTLRSSSPLLESDFEGAAAAAPTASTPRLKRQAGWSKFSFGLPDPLPDDSSEEPFGNALVDRHDENQRLSGEQTYACETRQLQESSVSKPTASDLPASYSAVRNPFETGVDQRRLADQAPIPTLLQGDCGSCYAIASSFVLRERAQAAIRRFAKTWLKQQILTDRLRLPDLSLQTVLSCSFYNQGCEGGYPMLVGKWAAEFGLPLHTCQEYAGSDTLGCPLHFRKTEAVDSASPCHPDNAVYSSGYGYVGGCYECCSEQSMREEIYHRGPIVAALDVSPRLFSYTGGVFRSDKSRHTRICDVPGKSLNGWEFTNHAVAVVGWGEEPDPTTGGTVKYWIVRNSWGPQWGEDGYFKILRGQNFRGIENQSVYIDPDIQRGYLKKLLQRLMTEENRSKEKNLTFAFQRVRSHNFISR